MKLLLSLLMFCGLAQAGETPDEARVRQLVTPRMGVNVKVDGVSRTPYAGLYEVRSNGDIFYTDAEARYMVVGKIVDLRTLEDLTRKRADELGAIRFSDLPLDAAIKVVKGNGKRVFAVFEDPHCPYCRKLHETLRSLDNVTIYTFLLDIVTEESQARSRAIWCAPDRARAWLDWIESSKAPPAPAASCQAPHDRVLALGKQLHIVGTPTIYFADGSRTGTAFDLAALESKLAKQAQ